MNEIETGAIGQSDALSLLAFLISSAEGCLKEPPLYGVYRLSTAAVQLAEVWEPNASAETAAVLRDIISRWEDEASLLSHEPKKLKHYLAKSGVVLADEIKRQASQGPGR